MNLTLELNSEQTEAVTSTEGPLIVLAGAGTGKTRVITYRIAYLLEEKRVLPHQILALTFTNKAAGEMKSRLAELCGGKAKYVWMGTFHSVGLAVLRRYAHELPHGRDFSVIDQEERVPLVRECLKKLEIDSKRFSPKLYLSAISAFKNTREHVDGAVIPEELPDLSKVFAEYEHRLIEQHLIDFDDMLSLSLRLFLNRPSIADYYRELCRYILVDEYQDTNGIQFDFLQALSGRTGNICVVGDDDQSIYGWRGAALENILNFEKHFDGVKEVKLVSNYRSARAILEVANKLISNNEKRRGKELRPAIHLTGSVNLRSHPTEREEASFAASKVAELLREGIPLTEIAVLYRTNDQSRNFESAFAHLKIPFKVVGGVGFYQRREVKDILAYLRLLDNPYDEQAFMRALKTPPKGVGDQVIKHVKEYSLEHHADLITSADALSAALPPRHSEGLFRLLHILEGIQKASTIHSKLELCVNLTGYIDYLYKTETKEDAESRKANVEELINAGHSYEEVVAEGTLSDFLEGTALATSAEERVKAAVSLMSVHAAKGLEFDAVFLTGLEKGIFPITFKDEATDEEEERRLCYVGVTRAKSKLYLTYARSRMKHGNRTNMLPSPFLKDMNILAKREALTRDEVSTAPEDNSFLSGTHVRHELFGEGMALSSSVEGGKTIVTVKFQKMGIKKILSDFLTHC